MYGFESIGNFRAGNTIRRTQLRVLFLRDYSGKINVYGDYRKTGLSTAQIKRMDRFGFLKPLC